MSSSGPFSPLGSLTEKSSPLGFPGVTAARTNAISRKGMVWRFMEPRFAMARRGSRSPIRLDVVAGSRAQRVDGAALPVGDGDLPGVAALAGEDEVAAVGSPRGVLAAPAARGDLTDLPGGQVDDSDVEADRSADLEARGVGDLAVFL